MPEFESVDLDEVMGPQEDERSEQRRRQTAAAPPRQPRPTSQQTPARNRVDPGGLADVFAADERGEQYDDTRQAGARVREAIGGGLSTLASPLLAEDTFSVGGPGGPPSEVPSARAVIRDEVLPAVGESARTLNRAYEHWFREPSRRAGEALETGYEGISEGVRDIASGRARAPSPTAMRGFTSTPASVDRATREEGDGSLSGFFSGLFGAGDEAPPEEARQAFSFMSEGREPTDDELRQALSVAAERPDMLTREARQRLDQYAGVGTSQTGNRRSQSADRSAYALPTGNRESQPSREEYALPMPDRNEPGEASRRSQAPDEGGGERSSPQRSNETASAQLPEPTLNRLRQLEEGQAVELKNGQIWRMRDGEPVRIDRRD